MDPHQCSQHNITKHEETDSWQNNSITPSGEGTEPRQVDSLMSALCSHLTRVTCSLEVLVIRTWTYIIMWVQKCCNTYTCCKTQMASRGEDFLLQYINDVLLSGRILLLKVKQSLSLNLKTNRRADRRVTVGRAAAADLLSSSLQGLHCLILLIWGSTWLWPVGEVTLRLNKLRVQTLCEHMSSVKRDKGTVYDHWQRRCTHYNPVWTMGHSKWVTYILVYIINKGHRLSWNDLNAFLSPASHPSLQTGWHALTTNPHGSSNIPALTILVSSKHPFS